MKRMGVLGGMSAQATMDFETRVHRVAQRLIPPDYMRGYPPMVVWFHRGQPLRTGADGRFVEPRQIEPAVIDVATQLGPLVDFLVVPCNAVHAGLREIRAASRRPVLSMIETVADDVVRRMCRRVGLLGARGVPQPYLDALAERSVAVERIDAVLQAPLDAGIRAIMEGREGKEHADAARAAVDELRGRGVDAVILGCTEIPLLLADEADAPDLIHPAALLADAAVRFSIA
jgi:aspartate racemase